MALSFGKIHSVCATYRPKPPAHESPFDYRTPRTIEYIYDLSLVRTFEVFRMEMV
jgi:hypothetical protein